MKTNHKAEVYNSPLIDEFLQEIAPVELERTRKRMLLAIRIDEGIKAKGWKKKDFSSAMKKSPSEITKWLSGTHNFTADTLFDIERVLDINLFQTEDKFPEAMHTFFYSVTIQSSDPGNYSCLKEPNEKSTPSYKTLGQFKSTYSN